MSNIKKSLKEAREAINKKDYQTTLKLCKSILKEEKDNYMALVFMGISLQEAGPDDQAPLAFKKAIESNPTNLLAWNGLANYYEKKNTADVQRDCFEVYIALLRLESNPKKIVDYIEKIINLHDAVDKEKFIYAVHDLFKKDELEYVKNAIRYNVNSFLNKYENLDKPLQKMHAEILEDIVNNPNTVSSKNYNNYLKLLYKLGDYTKLLESSAKMRELYENDLAPLEWICKAYVELYIADNYEMERLFCDIAEGASKRLLEKNQQSIIARLTKSVLLYKSNNILSSREILIEVTHTDQHMYGWLLLGMCDYKLGLYEDALKSMEKADTLYESANGFNQNISCKIKKLMADLLSRSRDSDNWKKAVKMCLQKTDTNTHSLTTLIRSYNNLKLYEESEKLLAELLKTERVEYLLLRADLLESQGKLEEALLMLTENIVDNFDVWLKIGLLHWNLEQYDKCLIPLLKATKLNSNSYICFYSLGQYYYKIGDLEKARRCYEKAFKLNGNSLEIGVELSKIYVRQNKIDANIIILENLISGKATVDNSWALSQLGVSYYNQCDYNKAIDCFRLVIRVNPDNSFCWESLGDAYMARGSYTSALKTYQTAANLNSNHLYPQLKIATVHRILGELTDARCSFENIIRNNKSCVPAFKGLAETCLNQAKEHQKSQLWGLAHDCAQYALDKLTVAIEHSCNVSCLWKLAADTFYLVANLPERYCCLFVLTAFAEGKDIAGSKMVEQEELFALAERCYSKGLALADNDIPIWYDLAKCFLSHARHTTDSVSFYRKAAAAIRYCVTNDPNNWQYWNLLGVVTFFQESKNYSLVQHAFIKAVNIERNSAISWCNLGALYLHLKEDKLANKAFAQAQRVDPTYVNSWVGQAFVAENVSPGDAMDLFRHCTQLGAHPQSATGYGYWVCKTLADAAPHTTIYSIHNMYAVPVACDALVWYTEKYPDDPCVWNMLGLLRERMGLKNSAMQAFRSALRLSESAVRDKIYMNYGRSLVALGKYSQAVDMFHNVKEATFNSGSGLALALFKDKQYEESYASYESALHWLTEDECNQSEVLVALASMAYLFQGPEETKTLLFQSFQLKNSTAWGLYAMLSLGLLHEDLELVNLVLKELEKIKDDPRCLPHYSVLLSYVYLLQRDSERAVRELSKLVHRYPSQASSWLSLSTLLIRVHSERPQSYAAARCAEIAMKLGQANMDVTKVLCVVSLGFFLVGNHEQALKSAQKAIHYYPNVPECWAVLISALIIKFRKDKEYTDNLKFNSKIDHIRNNMNLSVSLTKWLENCINFI